MAEGYCCCACVGLPQVVEGRSKRAVQQLSGVDEGAIYVPHMAESAAPPELCLSWLRTASMRVVVFSSPQDAIYHRASNCNCCCACVVLPQVVEGRSKRAVQQLSGVEGAAYHLAGAAPLGEMQLMDALDRAAADDALLRKMLTQVRAEQCMRFGITVTTVIVGVAAVWLAGAGADVACLHRRLLVTVKYA
jgi:hypothetical protein